MALTPKQQVLQDQFLSHLKTMFEKTSVVFTERGQQYNTYHAIPEFFIHGASDCVHEIIKKALRADSLIREGRPLEALDSFHDIINYGGFGGALILLESEGAVSGEDGNHSPR